MENMFRTSEKALDNILQFNWLSLYIYICGRKNVLKIKGHIEAKGCEVPVYLKDTC